MSDIINKAMSILDDDVGIDCIKNALKEAVEIINPNYEVDAACYARMFDEILLRSIRS